jgi:hypothetical protein
VTHRSGEQPPLERVSSGVRNADARIVTASRKR